MMRSLSSAVAGLRAHQTKMDVIGNNISNVNTYGFKASRTTFSDVYYQNIAGGKKGVSGSSGGTNPTQIGYGATVATIDIMNSATGAATTDKWSDVYITGEGFLVSKDLSGNVTYSRLGNLEFDAAGNLVDGNGRLIQGFPMRADGQGGLVPNISPDGTIVSDQLQPISIDPELLLRLTELSISNSGAITGLLKGDPMIDPKAATNPAWINNNTMSIPKNSVYDGPVNFAVSGLCSPLQMAQALDLQPNTCIDSIEMGKLPLPATDPLNQSTQYRVSVDKNGTVTLYRPPQPNATPPEDAVNLSGAIKDGKLVLKDKNSNVGLTINLNATAPTVVGTTIKTQNSALWDEAATSPDGSKIQFFNAAKSKTGTTYVAWAEDDGTNPAIDLSTEIFQSNGSSYPTPRYALFAQEEYHDYKYLDMDLHYQMTTTDKGGNAVKEPATPAKFAPTVGFPTNPTSYTFTDLGDLTLDITGLPGNGGFIGTIGTAGPGESTVYNVGNLVIAKFQNPSGLQQSGSSYFLSTVNSGEPSFVMPGLEGTGPLSAGHLEMSNVDVSKEFTEMITTQRGFQANSRIITVSDEMLQELVNLKR